jgi:hypothetical protein
MAETGQYHLYLVPQQLTLAAEVVAHILVVAVADRVEPAVVVQVATVVAVLVQVAL